ncbi:MAG: hypothetical protein AAF328_00405 [Planctomycetota bacterium]
MERQTTVMVPDVLGELDGLGRTWSDVLPAEPDQVDWKALDAWLFRWKQVRDALEEWELWHDIDTRPLHDAMRSIPNPRSANWHLEHLMSVGGDDAYIPLGVTRNAMRTAIKRVWIEYRRIHRQMEPQSSKTSHALTKTQKDIHQAVCELFERTGAAAKQQAIAERAGCDRSTVHDHLPILIGMGLIQRLGSRGGYVPKNRH